MKGKIIKISLEVLNAMFKENAKEKVRFTDVLKDSTTIIDGAVVGDELRLVAVDDSFENIPDHVVMPDLPLVEKI